MENLIILAGGLGTRLGKTGEECHKALLPVYNRPLIDYTLHNFPDGTFNRIIAGGYLFGDLVEQLQTVANLAYTGLMTDTGKRVRSIIDNAKLTGAIWFAYCDNPVYRWDWKRVKAMWKSGDVVLTAVRQRNRFGIIQDGELLQKPEQLVQIGYGIIPHEIAPYLTGSLEDGISDYLQDTKANLHIYEHPEEHWQAVDSEKELKQFKEKLKLWKIEI